MLFSPALDTSTLAFDEANLVPYVTFLPSLAATAWYHGMVEKGTKDLEDFLSEVREFAVNDYLPALFLGDALPSDRRADLVERLAAYTGLATEYVERSNLRIGTSRFMKELLRERGLGIGRLDARYTVQEHDNAGEFVETDPARAAMDSAYVAALHEHMAALGVSIEREYVTLNFEANRQWKRPEDQRGIFAGYLNVTDRLRRAMAANRDLHLFVANGYYDLTTAFFAAEYMFNQAGIDRSRLQMKHYAGGHMMYLHEPTFRTLSRDLSAFVRASSHSKAT
jgi:carboxypeptidase C (cathepsin A)